MKKSIKAALLSALIYPGAGHFFLKKSRVGVIFAGAFSIPLYFVISEIFAKAEKIVDQITRGEIALDPAAISVSLSNSMSGVEGQALDMNIYVLIIVWGIAIIDSYRLGITKK
ncbi:hypothetical protein Q4506_06275 [Colwellia sp. 4_MG-2023]|jgi:hypothetical protein|uniref:hypothetical protein n=1 Tax=unclassified Colwellia TaxID=196834 RepID=UPI001C086D33|nr:MULTISPECIES: hypothetical protein [unclassified Colwellia]MBU2925495.1 hypothetical protein [Colwellia sp. C2M11]MDO6486575.1 hypothetical protein [Colwellia sp. 6_MG-2023]MDO6506453.1 hypothetical protein [Colwellia sp. 5_MG-2023]MDO6555277.1 hypothetical protein [Colwellia sp. 4_MG-2023]MDO6651537.1 hypothetical protein [Colwellia sp. 3_MG-2023]